jgi:hypothetical protein
MAAKGSRKAKGVRSTRREVAHPYSVPNIVEEEADAAPDQPFAEGIQDVLDPDLRHRMISEAAYHRYADRGYEDGYDLDDWLQAEAEVDHLLLRRQAEGAAG